MIVYNIYGKFLKRSVSLKCTTLLEIFGLLRICILFFLRAIRTFFSYHKEIHYDNDALDINQCLCLPKAELKTKNDPKRSFLVFNSVH